MSRRDRGHFHYMANATALAFNGNEGSETFNYFATCQNARNTYLDTHVANYFMGPTLYDAAGRFPNVVTREGDPCGPADACYLLHADMLHEA